MRIECNHGYFKFWEDKVGQVSDFISRYGLAIEFFNGDFIFSDLVDAPDFSIKGGTFLGCPTTETFEGHPWEVMRANRIVYDFSTGRVVPIDTILQTVKLKAYGNFFRASGMIIPGSVMEDGSRVTDYAAHFQNPDFKYSAVDYE